MAPNLMWWFSLFAIFKICCTLIMTTPHIVRDFTFVNIQQGNIHINNKKRKSAPLQLSMLLFFIIKKKKMIYILQLKDHMTSQVGWRSPKIRWRKLHEVMFMSSLLCLWICRLLLCSSALSQHLQRPDRCLKGNKDGTSINMLNMLW